MERSIDLNALASFDAIALHGGIGPASRASGRPKATLSRHLDGLERHLGVRLVERGDRRMRLTEDGRRLHERSHALLTDLADVAEALADDADTPRGHLRISAPVVFAHHALMPVIARYRALHPQVTLDVVAEDRRVDPVEDGYDLVIRIDPRPDERLIGRRLALDARVVVATPDRALPDAEVVATPGFMLASWPHPTWPIRDADGRPRTIVPDLRLRLSSPLMIRDAALAGLGAALLPQLLVASDVAAGRLVLWGRVDAPDVEIWALHPSRRLTSPKVRTFLATLADTLARGETS